MTTTFHRQSSFALLKRCCNGSLIRDDKRRFGVFPGLQPIGYDDPKLVGLPSQSEFGALVGVQRGSGSEVTRNAIVAIDKNNAIGKGGAISWHYSSDLKFFRKQTSYRYIVIS
jgi:hypothetical protein